MMNGADDLYDLDFLAREDLDVFFTELKSKATEVVEANLRERAEEPMSFLNSLYN
jgi:hypothetical protein